MSAVVSFGGGEVWFTNSRAWGLILGVRRPGRGGPDDRRAAHPARHRAGDPGPEGGLRDDRQGQHAALYMQLKKLPWALVPAVSAVGTGHGRRARRTVKAVLASR